MSADGRTRALLMRRPAVRAKLDRRGKPHRAGRPRRAGAAFRRSAEASGRGDRDRSPRRRDG